MWVVAGTAIDAFRAGPERDGCTAPAGEARNLALGLCRGSARPHYGGLPGAG